MWWLRLMFQTLDIADSLHLSRVWEVVVHWVVGGSGFLIASNPCLHTANLGQAIQPPLKEESELQQQPRNS